jgi:TonB family protein
MHNLRAPLVLPWLLLAHIGLAQTTSSPTRDPASTTDQVRLSEILIRTPEPYDPEQVADARRKAEQVRAAIGRNGTFADIATADSQGPSAAQGGDLGCFHHGNLAKALDELVFRMQVGDVSDVLRTKQGFVILEVSGRGADACFARFGSLDILNDTQGVDFRPYLKPVLEKVRENWHRLIPESAAMKKGKVAIEFAIKRDGSVADMRLAATSGDAALDRAAWEGIYSSSPFSALPAEFTGPYLALRFRFHYNPSGSEAGQSLSPAPEVKSQTPAISSDQNSQNHDFGLGVGTQGRQFGALEILSDTHGVDFGPYVSSILEDVRQNWYRLIPPCAQTMKGKVAIEFAITKDGRIADMRLVATSDDAALDRAAWGGIYASGPFPALPSEFTGPYLALRFHFSYNPDKSDLAPQPDNATRNSSLADSSGKGCPGDPVLPALTASHPKTKSGIAVSIAAPVLGDTDVPLGGSKVVTAVVTGTGSKENTVEWNISGFGCSGTSCGEMNKDSYQAPAIMPSSPFVTLTAVSTADPSAKASVTLHIIPSPSR